MIVYEIEHEHEGHEDAAALAVYGRLHRLLGTNPSRRLLGPEATATMTSSNFLVVHHLHGGPWLDEYESKNHDGSRFLAVGERRWDICGIDRNVRCAAAMIAVLLLLCWCSHAGAAVPVMMCCYCCAANMLWGLLSRTCVSDFARVISYPKYQVSNSSSSMSQNQQVVPHTRMTS